MKKHTINERWMQKTVVVWLGAMLCCFLWGSAFPCIKIGYELFGIAGTDTATQILFAGIRFILAGILAVGIGSLLQGRLLLPEKQACGKILWLSLLQTVLQYLFFYIGLAHTSGVKASIIEAVNVFVAILVAGLIFRQEKVDAQKLLGCLVGFAGVVLINLNGVDFRMSFSGEGAIFLSTVAYAFSSVFLKRYSAKHDPVMLSGYQFIAGGLILSLLGLLMGGRLQRISLAAVGILVYLAIVSAVAYSLWGMLLKYNPISRVAVFGFMNPVFGVLLSALLLKENDQAFGVLGIASLLLVCLGIYIVNRGKKTSKQGTRYLVAVDSYKGSMTSLEAGNAIAAGIREAQLGAAVQVVPVADGGEGTVEALTRNRQGVEQCHCQVTGPLGTTVDAAYTIYNTERGKTAIIEMASAAGLPLVPEEQRNPLHTTTYGVGEMIRHAIEKGCRQFIIGIGGSATNDGGIGMLQALGWHFTDAQGHEVGYGAEGLERITAISSEDVLPELAACEFRIACDVRNPLTGVQGCSYVFAPQKGADESMVERMDQAMLRYAGLTEQLAADGAEYLRSDGDHRTPGTGAAGGLGYAFYMYLHGILKPGIDIVLEEIDLQSMLSDVDCVITGEGRMDAQTLMGKTPAGVAELAKKQGKTVLAFAGCFGDGIEMCKNSSLFDACYSVTEYLEAGLNGQGSRSRQELEAEELEKRLETEQAIRNLTACVRSVASDR